METDAKTFYGEVPPREWLAAIRMHPQVRKGVKIALDAGIAAGSLAAVGLILHRGLPDLRSGSTYLVLAMAVNLGFRFHTQHYRVASLAEAGSIFLGNVVLVAAAMGLCFMHRTRWPSLGPPDVVLGACLLTGPLWFGLRLVCVIRHRQRHRHVPAVSEGSGPKRTLIVGAGGAGTLLCQELREHPRHPWEVVGFIDDALEKQGVRIHGVLVLGPTRLLPVFLKEQRAAQVILCLPGAPGARLRELAELARSAGAEVKTVPGIADLVGDRPWKPEVRDIAIEDLLRREPVALDTAAIRAALRDAVVLITGAGGSIGSELARRVADLGPGRLVLLGRGENSLWQVHRELTGLFPGLPLTAALCDVRNRRRLNQVFQAWRPQVVLHAAAHKHVPLLEEHPGRSGGEQRVRHPQRAGRGPGGGRPDLVNVSTDKAVNPVSVLGVSKRIGELMLAARATGAPTGSRLVSVRFGNVLGSRGSVIPIFRDQIRMGGPVTVTHPDMVRYFMTIPEAAQLVLQAGLLGGNGKVFALDMGDPVRIVELARELIRLSGYRPEVDMEIRYTGVRPGEKLVEELFSSIEERQTQVHAKVLEAVQDQVDPALLSQGLVALERILRLPEPARHQEMLECFLRLVPSVPAFGQRPGALPAPGPGRSPRHSAQRHSRRRRSLRVRLT